ncbi:MAG: CPBP family intramembrane metalloprotease [Bacteroidetes bacterium]|nr:MAG: CPBP family intramembrane metalloprotease [Bacteroidota bacterium]
MLMKQKTDEGILRKFIAKHPLFFYFFLTYAITWVFLIPFVYIWRVVLDQSFELWLLVFLPGAYGPTIAALIMTHLLKGKRGIRDLLAKLLLWRVRWKWYFFVILVPITLLILAISLSDFREMALASFIPDKLLAAIPLYLLIALPFGPLAEELGWRGFALPRLQARFTPLVSSLIIGVIWTFWHTPMFWFPGAAIPSFLELSAFSILLYLIQTTAEAILFTTVFNYTRGSVLIAIVFHMTINASENILFSALPEPSSTQQMEIHILMITFLCILAFVCTFFISGRQVVPK